MTKNTLNKKSASFSLRNTTTALGTFDKPANVHENKAPTASKGKKDYTRFNFICDNELVRKVRSIAIKEGVTIRQIMEKAMTDWLSKYEKKNGPVGDVKARSVEDL